MHSIGFAFFFFNDTATTEIYTLSLHDALPISLDNANSRPVYRPDFRGRLAAQARAANAAALSHLALSAAGSPGDRKSTRLNSSHGYISYAVFCLKKKIADH